MSDTDSKNSLPTIGRYIAVVTIVTPFLALFIAIYLLWHRAVSSLDLILCGSFYVVTMLGITLGFHRFFTHRSFKCVLTVKVLLGICGCMAAQGPILFWVAYHRRHHRFSDGAGDPHSPHAFGGNWPGVLQGWWHAHTGWMLTPNAENYFRLVPDLIRDRPVLTINRFYFVWIALGLLAPATIGGLLEHTWSAAATGLLWGGLVRIFLVHHSTWSINSICHLFGTSLFRTEDRSRNNALCAVLTFGEGWHNNHHAFPTSARHGLFWWQFDFVYILISLLHLGGLAWDIRKPDSEQITQRLRQSL